MPNAIKFQLYPHPSSDANAFPLNIDGHASFSGSRLMLEYRVSGAAFERVVWPRDKSDTQPCDNLWQHTCFECFLAKTSSSSYFEFNFSPAGDWAAYRFDDYRIAMARAEIAPQAVQTRFSKTEQQAVFQVEVDTPHHWDLHRPLEMAICAVIESDAMHYFALAHSSDKPDFHQRNSFILQHD